MTTKPAVPSKSKNTILYVDDEPNNLMGFKSVFRRHFKIHTATSAKEGLEIMANHPIQLVISDQRMPNMTGTEFLQEVSEMYPDVIRIILTGYSDYEATLDAINNGKVYKYLMKPWETENLKQIIDGALGMYELRQENERLLDNLKKVNTELDRFVYSASHDLRAPIASLLGLINLAKRSEEPHEIKELLKIGEKVLAQLEVFIKDIADYSRNVKTGIQSEVIDFSVFFEDILDHYKFYDDSAEIDKIIEVIQTQEFRSDTARLKVIFKNLISNSIRYADLSKNAFLKLRVDVMDNEATIQVIDNGKGIASHHLERIFDMFYRATDSKAGSGLGLFIVKETVEKLYGSISVASEYAEGTTFTLRFPSIEPNQEEA